MGPTNIIFNESTMEFRYISGLTMYSERFDSGRLLCKEYNTSGMPHHTSDVVASIPTPAFSLVVDGKDASFDWDFQRFDTDVLADGRQYATLELNHSTLELSLSIRTECGENGFFSRRLYLKNNSNKKVSITSVAPLCGSLWEQKHGINDSLDNYRTHPFKVGAFKEHGWSNEGNFHWYDVDINSALNIGSEMGFSGHSHPFAIASSSVLGGYFICQMEWGANWNFSFKNDFLFAENNGMPSHLRMKFSLSPTAIAPMRVMDAHETVEIPAVHYGFVSCDFDEAIYRLHTYQRNYLLAKPYGGYDLVSYDHWGYVTSRLTEEALIKEVERAAEVGAELFVVDAGWYGSAGSDWFGTVGDWHQCRLPNDLHPVINRSRDLGLKFGLWVEPESVGKNSELVSLHPEWLMKRYGNPIERSLDITRPEVEAYITEQLIDVIERYQLDLLRLDYNNQYLFEGGFNANGEYTENTHWRHVEATHRIFDRIKARFPKLWLENCASGGGRTDLGMMTRFSKTQISDWYKFPRIARTFNGMSMCLPPETLMFEYGAAQSESRYGSADAQIQMTIQGIPRVSGIAIGNESENPAYLKTLKRYIELYKSFIRPIQSSVKLYHHTQTIAGFNGMGFYVKEAMLPDGSRGYVNLVRLQGENEDTYLLKLRGLDASRRYKLTCLTENKTITADGYTLTAVGMPIRLDNALCSEMILIESV